jgi:hypothetical protein
VHAACEKIGRAPGSLGYRASVPKPKPGTTPSLDEAVERITKLTEALVAIGVDHVTLPLREYAPTVDAMQELVAALAAR